MNTEYQAWDKYWGLGSYRERMVFIGYFLIY